MPVYRFKDFQSARDALFTETDPKVYMRRARWLWAITSQIAPPRIPRGVRRYRSLEDALADRESHGP